MTNPSKPSTPQGKNTLNEDEGMVRNVGVEASGDARPSARPETPVRQLVKVSASALYRLLPILAKRDDCTFRNKGGQHLWGWRVEPCAAGGALVIATCGTAIGVIHDPEARVAAPATILASDGLRTAVTPPPTRPAYYEGDYEDLDLPDEFQPGAVYASTAGAFVTSRAAEKEAGSEDEREHHMIYHEMAEFGSIWAGGYRLVDEYVDWRRTFAAWAPDETTASHQRLSPTVFSSFRNIYSGTLEIAMPADQNLPVLVQAAEHPDFVGLVMRGSMLIRPPPSPGLPAWLAENADASDALRAAADLAEGT